MNNIAEQFVRKAQSIYNNQKRIFNINLRGESSLLLYLYKRCKEDVTPGNISEDLMISTARVAASLNSLENKGYLTREIDKEDRRKIIIKLTIKGKAKGITLKEERLNYLNRVFSSFEKNEVEEIMRLINKLDVILANMEEIEVEN